MGEIRCMKYPKNATGHFEFCENQCSGRRALRTGVCEVLPVFSKFVFRLGYSFAKQVYINVDLFSDCGFD
jgi:hypothetical protein